MKFNLKTISFSVIFLAFLSIFGNAAKAQTAPAPIAPDSVIGAPGAVLTKDSINAAFTSAETANGVATSAVVSTGADPDDVYAAAKVGRVSSSDNFNEDNASSDGATAVAGTRKRPGTLELDETEGGLEVKVEDQEPVSGI